MSIDPRLLERRRLVAEDRARRKVSRLLKLLVGLTGLGALVWLASSPLLSVREVVTVGVSASSAHRALVELGVTPGAPMILLRPGTIQAGLLEDPWVRRVEVELEWPQRIRVEVEERRPAAWVETGDGWRTVAVDGVVLASAEEPDGILGRVLAPGVGEGDTDSSPWVLGSVRFLATLAPRLQAETVVWRDGNELWAETGGFLVRLGREVDMEDKARALEALLLVEELAPGATINLIAPTHPAVIPPNYEGQVEG